MLDLNITLLFQLVNFFVALFLLNIVLIKPVREILKKRQSNIDAMTNEAESFETKAETSLATYEATLQRARQEAGQIRLDSRNAGVAEQQSIVGEAQKNARTIVEDARLSLQKQADAALDALRGQADQISAGLVARLLKG